MRRRPDVFSALALLAAIWPLSAHAERAVLPPLDPPKTGAVAPHDAAVVIGIEDYAYLPDVPFAQRDGRLVHRFLTDTVGVPVERISNLFVRPATRAAILKAVRERSAEVGPDGTLWIYFSGHGLPWSDGDTTEALLVGQSATQGTLRDDSVSKAELLKAAQVPEGSRGVVVLLDACFSGKDRAGASLSGARFGGAVTLGVTPNTVVWTAAQGNQIAGTLPEVQHGIFTYFAVGALSGWARETGGSGVVRVADAQRYVDRAMRVAEAVRGQPQQPHLAAPTPTLQWRLTERAGDPPRPDLDAYGRGGRTFVAVVPVPRVAPVKPFSLPPGGFRDVDVQALTTLQEAVRTERSDSATPAERASAWDAVARHQGTSAAHRRQAEERAQAWRAFVAAERARAQQEAEVRVRFAADRDKLRHLLALDDEVVSASMKQRWRQEFVTVWTPWRQVVGDDPLFVEIPATAREASGLRATDASAQQDTLERDEVTDVPSTVEQQSDVSDFEAQKHWLQLSAAGYIGAVDLGQIDNGVFTFDGTQLEPLNAMGFAVNAAFSARWLQAGVGLRFAAARLTDAQLAGFESISIYSTTPYAFFGPQFTWAESIALRQATVFVQGMVGSEFLQVAGDSSNDGEDIDVSAEALMWGGTAGFRYHISPAWGIFAAYRFEQSDLAQTHGAAAGLVF